MNESVREIARRDGRYAIEAFQFLFEALDHSVKRAGREHAEGAERHVSGQELLLGLREYASELFGPLAAQVWRSWGVKESLDWGRIVFVLVDGDKLKRQENDTIDDFRDGFDFEEAFVDRYRVQLPPEVLSRNLPGDD